MSAAINQLFLGSKPKSNIAARKLADRACLRQATISRSSREGSSVPQTQRFALRCDRVLPCSYRKNSPGWAHLIVCSGDSAVIDPGRNSSTYSGLPINANSTSLPVAMTTSFACFHASKRSFTSPLQRRIGTGISFLKRLCRPNQNSPSPNVTGKSEKDP